MPAMFGFNNLLNKGTVTASTEATGYAKENAYDWNTYDYWQPTAVPAYLTVDMSVATTCDYFALAAHDLFSNSASIQLQYSSDNFALDINDAFAAITPTDNSPIFQSFTSQSARYWRVVLTGGISSLGFVLFGDRLDSPVNVRDPFELVPFSRDSKVTTNVSEGGQFLGRAVVRDGANGSLEMDLLTPAWIRSNWDTFAAHIETKPFILQWDNTNYPDETVLAWLTGSVPTPEYSRPQFLTVELKFKAQAR